MGSRFRSGQLHADHDSGARACAPQGGFKDGVHAPHTPRAGPAISVALVVPADAEHVAGHAGELHVGLSRGFSTRLRTAVRVSISVRRCRTNSRRSRMAGGEAPGDQAVADQLSDPLRICHVGLTTGHVLTVVGACTPAS